MTSIVHSLEPVTLVGAGKVQKTDLLQCIQHAPCLVAADGGALFCLDAQLVPNAVIGDMDSLDHATRAGLPADRVHQIYEQDSTDFDKALRNISTPLVLGVGFDGGRLDHVLGCFNTLVRHPSRRCILVGDTDLVFLAPPEIVLPLVSGTRVSLFPMGPVQGRSEGLRWEIDGLVFAPDGQMGVSNVATGPVHLQFEDAKMLVILPKETLELAIGAFVASQTGSWSAL